MKSRYMNFIIFLFTLILFYVPILIIFIFSFNTTKSSTWEGFSFRWYQELLTHSPKIWESFQKSMIIGLLSSCMATTIGGMGAWAISHRNCPMKKFLLSLSYMPLMLPDLIMGVSLLTLFVLMYMPLGMETIFIAHTTMNIPFAFLLILAVIEDSDLSVLEAARDLGANEIQIWLRILLPILSPGLIASLILTFTMSLDDFIITFFISGSGSTTLPIYIYSAIRFGLSPAVNVLSVFIIAGSLILFSFNKKLARYFIR